MLTARSIAFIGGDACEPAIAYARALGFSGELFAVNARRETLGGLRCHPTVRDLPRAPDAAWVAVPAEATPGVMRDLAAIGAGGAVCYTAGFSEIGTAALEGELVRAAAGMALLGPNCTGLASFADRTAICVGEHGFAVPARGVACVAQSGTFASVVAESDRSLPLTHFVSVGNGAALDIADAVAVLCEDARVDAILLYLEGLRDGPAFAEAAARAWARGVPIVCLKAGRSEAGRAAALSHTGALSASMALYDAFFDRFEIVRAETIGQAIETAKVLALGRPLRGRRLAVLTASGWDAGTCTDLAGRHGIALPQPAPERATALASRLPAVARAANPLDVTMALWNDADAQAGLLAELAVGADAALMVLDAPPRLAAKPDYAVPVDAMIDVAQRIALPCYVASNLPEGQPETVRTRLLAAGVVPLQGIDDAFAALGLAARHAERRAAFDSGGSDAGLIGTGTRVAGPHLSERESKAHLSAHGLRVPAAETAATAAAAAEAAVRIGFPVVLKAVGLAHKTELGAVALGLADAEAVGRAARAMDAAAGPGGYLVEEMIEGAVCEIIVGVVQDPALGLTLTLGSGGVLAELVGDVAHLSLPAGPKAIRRTIGSLRAARLIAGHRGGPAGDMDALVEAVSAICRYAQAEAHALCELDVNPVLVLREGAVAVDALIRLSDAPSGAAPEGSPEARGTRAEPGR